MTCPSRGEHRARRLRDQPQPRDVEAVAALLRKTGFFTDAEVDVARELVETALAQGPRAGYTFFLADGAEALEGYVCFGPVPAAPGRFDLYWIAVDPGLQRSGIGRCLLAAAERAVVALQGSRIYIETSARRDYAPTRRFYEACGYSVAARLPDFYADGDDKLVYVKVL